MPFIEISVTVPKEIVNTDRVRQAIMDKMKRKTGPDLKTAFRLVTLTWQHSPDYQAKYVETASSLATQVFPTGPNAKLFAMINNGARRHVIMPKRAPVLRFKQGYRAKSRPRFLHAEVGGKFGDYVTAHSVNHPGFEAREFTQTIAEVYDNVFRKDMQDAIRDGTK